jgi:hypothetical protein
MYLLRSSIVRLWSQSGRASGLDSQLELPTHASALSFTSHSTSSYKLFPKFDQALEKALTLTSCVTLGELLTSFSVRASLVKLE